MLLANVTSFRWKFNSKDDNGAVVDKYEWTPSFIIMKYFENAVWNCDYEISTSMLKKTFTWIFNNSYLFIILNQDFKRLLKNQLTS